MANLIYPKLSYKIIGILFKVHSELEGDYQEKYYQRAVEIALKEEGVSFKREISANLSFNNKMIGKYVLDFLIEERIILELKAKPNFTRQDFKQVRSYLKSKKLELGILANFKGEKLTYKRILNRVS